jgi:hypothetical protein
MIVAKARYNGRTRGYTRKCQTGESYHFPHGTDEPIVIESVDDAEELERARNVEVEWTARGKLMKKVGTGADLLESVKEESYQWKRSLASSVGLEFEEQPDEETLDEEIRSYIEQQQEQGRL